MKVVASTSGTFNFCISSIIAPCLLSKFPNKDSTNKPNTPLSFSFPCKAKVFPLPFAPKVNIVKLTPWTTKPKYLPIVLSKVLRIASEVSSIAPFVMNSSMARSY